MSMPPIRPRASRLKTVEPSCPARERGKYLFRIARLLQERARELAVPETMDGGKPIKESRDVDLPLVAAHFFYHAGWADKLDYAFPGRTPRRSASCGQIIPWNFPLLMAAWKIAPALACGNTCRPQARRDHLAHRAASSPRSSTRPDLPPGVVNIVTGAGETGAGAGRSPGRRQDRLHRLDRGRQGDRMRAARRHAARRLTLELGGKAANIIFDDAPIDQAVEGIINGIYFNQGHVCCAGSRLFVQEVDRRRGAREARAPHPNAARRRSARQEHRHRRDQLARSSSTRSASWCDCGVDEGAAIAPAGVPPARARATGSRRPSSHGRHPEPPRSPARRSSARCSAC